MHRSLKERLLCVVILGLVGSSSTFAQDATSGQEEAFNEEIIVRGAISRGALRIQIQRAERDVYERFNEINSTDDFDIHCSPRARTGTHIVRRSCAANFEREAESEIGKEIARSLSVGSPLGDPVASMPPNIAGIYGAATARKREMEREMARLFAEDAQLRAAFVHIADLQQTLRETRRSRRSGNDADVSKDEGDEGLLPFGASVMAGAEIGQDFWIHELSHRTFSIVDLDGAIGSIRLRCRDAANNLVARDLNFEPDVEWNLPAGLNQCTVRVEARPGTTFNLYEFEQ